MLTKLFINKNIVILSVIMLVAGCSKKESPEPEKVVASPPSVVAERQKANNVVVLSTQAAEELKIKTVTITKAPFMFNLAAPATVYPSPENISIISAPITGRVSKIYAHEGERISKESPLLELESLEYANLVADYLENMAESNYLEQQVTRVRQLVEKQISPQRSLERAEADFSRSLTQVKASKARLKAVGVSDAQITEWSKSGSEPSATLTIYAPIAGTVNEHLIELGSAVASNQKMMDIVDNSKVLVRGFVPPEDATMLKPGLKAVVSKRTENNPDNTFGDIEAEITSINPSLDEMNRAIPINCIIDTKNGWPVIGQNVRIEFFVSTQEPVVTVPLSAIQFEGNSATLFVQIEPNKYEKRNVTIYRMTDTNVIISTGLREGEKVAVSQIFSLKALGKFEEFSE